MDLHLRQEVSERDSLEDARCKGQCVADQRFPGSAVDVPDSQQEQCLASGDTGSSIALPGRADHMENAISKRRSGMARQHRRMRRSLPFQRGTSEIVMQCMTYVPLAVPRSLCVMCILSYI